MEEQGGVIMEERDELMLISTRSNPTYRHAHFLKPTQSSPDVPSFDLPPLAFRSNYENLQNLGPQLAFLGWKKPIKGWKEWVDAMKPLHQQTWHNASIYDAVISSTCRIKMSTDVVLGLAERWCSDTNSFVFPWGEATISLEDMMVLDGFSVAGQSVLCTMDQEAEVEFTRIDEKFNEVRVQLHKTRARKASQKMWMDFFRGSGSNVEHEAFLVLWLSRDVFPFAHNTVGKHLHKMAFYLARGTKLALAPAILSGLYRDLRLLKKKIISFSENRATEVLRVWSLMHLVQIWARERFPALRPKPNFIRESDTRMSRWDNVTGLPTENVRLVIDAAAKTFVWRPYAKSEKFKFYPEKEEQVPVSPGMHEHYESFAKFIRVAELVGLDCVEPYFPHRASMQFGMDQDIPGKVDRCNETREIAWQNFIRPIGDEKLYIPSRLFQPAITRMYLEWWKKSKAVGETEEGTSKASRTKKKMVTEKLVLNIDDEDSPGNDRSQRADNEMLQHPPGFCKSIQIDNPVDFEPTKVSENMITRNDEAVTELPAEVRARTGVIEKQIETRITRLEKLAAQLKKEMSGPGSIGT